MFLGKLIVLCISESTILYKTINLVNLLVENHADVHVIMTKKAANLINPIIFESITHNRCLGSKDALNNEFEDEIATLIKSTDLILISPASANMISSLSRGMADDILTKTVLSCDCTKLVAPALSASVYKNPIVQDNIDILKAYGFDIIDTKLNSIKNSSLVFNDYMASEQEIFDYCEKYLFYKKDLLGMKVLVTAGSTMEIIDPMKCIVSSSTGKTGYEIAKVCMLRGADVTLVTGKTNLNKPSFINVVEVLSSKDMFMAVNKIFDKQHIIINAAGIVDYAPDRSNLRNLSTSDDFFTMRLRKNPDLAQYLGENKTDKQFICNASMETHNVFESAKKELYEKNLDMVLVSSLKSLGTEFTSNTEIATIITKSSEIKLNKMTKYEMAQKVIDQILLEINL